MRGEDVNVVVPLILIIFNYGYYGCHMGSRMEYILGF
jgi:hypothetical protein